MAPQFLISVENALCRVNRHANLRIESFSIHQGEHWCVFGPNGSGKSLLAALLSGRRVESGQYVTHHDDFDSARDCLFVSFEEQQRLWQRDNRLDMSEYSERAEDQGTLVEALIQSGKPTSESDEAALGNIIAQLDLDGLLHKGIRFLSSGQIRRVLIARALYAAIGSQQKLIIFDDPLEAIDKDSRERIIQCIAHYQSSGFTSLFLCRREKDIPEHVSHLAVMDGLSLIDQGDKTTMLEGETLQRMFSRIPEISAQIPSSSANSTEPTNSLYIELKQISANYGELSVLHDVNWKMSADDHVLIEGPNGCGKSTLLSLIDGENHKGYGQEVYLFGKRKGSGETIWEIKSKFGVVSNELHNKYVKGWKVLDVVVSGYFDSVGLYDESGATEWEGARQWLATLGIANLETHYYHELSFGQQRLVLLARAMVKQPMILVLDEPCVGLDDFHRELILGTLQRIAEQTTTRIIYVSHVTDEQPSFMTQRLRFIPVDSGGYTIEQQAI